MKSSTHHSQGLAKRSSGPDISQLQHAIGDTELSPLSLCSIPLEQTLNRASATKMHPTKTTHFPLKKNLQKFRIQLQKKKKPAQLKK